MADNIPCDISSKKPLSGSGILRCLSRNNSLLIDKYRLETENDVVFFDAVAARDKKRVRQLIADGFNINMKIRHEWDKEGNFTITLLELAMEMSSDGMAVLLIRSGIDLVGYTDLVMTAVDSGCLPMTESLLIGLAKKNKDYRNPLMKNRTAHYAFLRSAARNNIKNTRNLLEIGVPVDYKNRREETALLLAVENGNYNIVVVLLNSKVSLESSKRDGRGPLDIAISKDDRRIIKLLLGQLFSVSNINDTVDPALDYAIRHKRFPEAVALLDSGKRFVQREQRRIQLERECNIETLVGLDDIYLKKLCSTVGSLIISTKDSKDHDTGSDKATLQALQWLLACLTEHPNCINAEGPLPLLPSRVIDVGPADGSQCPNLVETQNGSRGRYITLSHRWGASCMTKTTKGNLAERLSYINFDTLTQTMKDAVIITRKLEVRYLWVDALCIIQDCHIDWTTQACNMANIYRNSLLTIAAAAAAEPDHGCFTSRSEAETHKSRTSVLDSRGWILQEQLLSPRILEYSYGHLNWECISMNVSEKSFERHPSEDAIRFKRALNRLRSTSMEIQEQAHASWHLIVEAYSRRQLTNDADKLMAIMGIAKYTGEITGDKSFAGLWQKTLWRDLLWSSVSDPYGGGCLPRRLNSINLPSWTWASVNGPISYTWPLALGPRAAVTVLLDIVTVDADSDISKGDLRGRIIVKALLRKVFLRNGDTTRLFHTEFTSRSTVDAGKEDPFFYFQTARDHEYSEFWRPDISLVGAHEIFLLQIASDKYWTYTLALLKVESGGCIGWIQYLASCICKRIGTLRVCAACLILCIFMFAQLPSGKATIPKMSLIWSISLCIIIFLAFLPYLLSGCLLGTEDIYRRVGVCRISSVRANMPEDGGTVVKGRVPKFKQQPTFLKPKGVLSQTIVLV